MVDTRKSGNSIYYRLRDPQVTDLLDVARRIFDSHVIELRAMIEESEPEEGSRDGSVSADIPVPRSPSP